jgi:hypothetical protein
MEMESKGGNSLYHQFDSTDIVNITDLKVEAFDNIDNGKN